MRKTLLFGIITSLYLVFGNNTLSAQTDTEFWFVVPGISENHGDKPIRFVFTTTEFNADITIEMPANPGFTPIYMSIPANSTIDTSFYSNFDIFRFENNTLIEELSQIPSNKDNISNKGIRILSSSPITAYYEVNTLNNSDIWTLKGRNGLGKDFYVPFQDIGQNRYYSYPIRGYSSIEIIGTGETTTIEIYPSKAVYRDGLNQSETNPYTITLEQGEVYTLAPAWDPTVRHGGPADLGWWGVFRDQHLGGTYLHVVSGDDVAVVIKDDSVCEDLTESPTNPRMEASNFAWGGWDIIADQLVPLEVLGKEYVAMRGALSSNEEFLFAVATENNTRIWWTSSSIDTSLDPVSSVVNKGDQVRIPFPDTETYKYVISNNKLSVLHVSGVGKEMGGAILPPIDKCTGSTSVPLIRDLTWPLYINIMVRAGAENNFLIDGNVRNDIIDPTSFIPVGSTGEWLVTQIYYADSDLSDFPVGVTRIISNTKDVFHLGLINGNAAGGCRYGYFSDFNEIKAGALFIQGSSFPTSTIRACVGDTVQLYASGGVNYSWWPSANLSNDAIACPKALVTEHKVYYVEASGACNIKDTTAVMIEAIDVPTADFTLNSSSGISPLTIQISNISDANNHKWYWDDVDLNTPDYETTSNTTFNHTYNNNTSTTIIKTLTLIVENELGCSDTLKKLITILPQSVLNPINTLWFAVPYGTDMHDNWQANLVLTATDLNNSTNVIITQPYNPVMDTIYITIDPSISTVADIYFDSENLAKIMNNTFVQAPFIPSPFISNSAVKIESDREISAFYEYQRTGHNVEVFPLKADDALGNDFWVPQQNIWSNHNYNFDPAFSQIILTSTRANTEVTITFTNDAYGLPAGTYSFNLAEPGMTLMFVPKANAADGNEPSYLASDRLVGTHITSNKPISVTIADDSVQKGGAYDLVGDQLVPVKNLMDQSTIGKEYIVQKGEINDVDGNEKVFVLTTENNTNVSYTIKGKATVNNPVPSSGSQVEINLLQATSDDFVFIIADKPVYVFHVSGFGAELGGAIVPAIDGCRGSFEVNFMRSKTQDFYLNIITHQDATNSFEISIDGEPYVPFLSSSDFEAVGFGDYYVLKKTSSLQNSLPMLTSLQIKNSANMFHLGSLNGVSTGGGCAYGYFSNYSENRGEAVIVNSGSDILTTCFGEEVQFKASGGTSYSWTPTTYLDDPNSPEPKATLPVGIHMYQVQITRECYTDSTLNIAVEVYENSEANFVLNSIEGCSPLSIELENLSLNADTFQIDWDNDGIYDTFFNNTMLQNYQHTFLNTNQSDTVFTVLLKAWHRYKECFDIYEKQIIVKPQISADLILNTNEGCSPIMISFTNNSTGVDSVYINYGDGSVFGSTTFAVENHSYKNTGTSINKYPIEFIVYNAFGCSDTIRDTVRVYPEVNANYTIDGNNYTGCNSREVVFTNTSNYGTHTASSFLWTFGDGTDSTTVNSVVNHTYLNSTNSDAIYTFNLHAESQYGCSDDTTHALVIYKAVADFEIDEDQGCSPLSVSITNNSIGTQINTWNWDFGDGTTSNIQSPAARTFTNTTGTTIVRNMELTVTGTNGCSSSETIPISVYSSVEIVINPLNVWVCDSIELTFETSIIPEISGSTYYWDFKDGASSDLREPSHIFRNTSSPTQVLYPVKAYVETPSGCLDSALSNITVNPYVKAKFVLDKNVGCSPVTINAEPIPQIGINEYRWDFGDGTYINTSSAEIQNHTFPDNTSGVDVVYNVKLEVVDPSGICTDYQTIPVTVYSKAKADFDPQHILGCNPVNTTFNNFSLNAVEYLWNFGDGTTSSEFEPSHVFTNTTNISKIYNINLVATSINGCSHDTSSTITVYSNISSNFSVENSESCSPLNTTFENLSLGNTINTYQWQIDDIPVEGSPPDLSSFNYTFENLSSFAKDYIIKLTATNSQGCESVHEEIVTVYSELITELVDSSNVSCFGASNGFLSVQAINGVPPYSYIWNTGETTPVISELDGGIYTVTTTDSKGCSRVNAITVQEPPQIDINIEYSNVSCHGASDGSMAVSPIDGIATFIWSTGATESNISNLTSGMYSVTVTSENGCISLESQIITEPELLLIETDSYSDSICPSNGGYINLTVYGGTSPYSYNWSNGETTEDISNLNPGNYLITVSDINDCISIKDYTIDTIRPYEGEKICLVSIDPNTEKNSILWEKTQNKNIVYYNIYRYNSNYNSYQSIGLVPFNDADFYIDNSSNPSEQSYKYKISNINICADESSLSNSHKTILLTATTNSEKVSLNWEPYEIESESVDLLNYILFKGDDSTSLNAIDTLLYTVLSYEDPLADLSKKNFYKIAATKLSSCNINDESYGLIYSNITNSDIQTNINSPLENEIALNLFPNPFKNDLTINYVLKSAMFVQIEIFNVVGEKVITIIKENESAGIYKHIFNPEKYGCSTGIYYLKFTFDNQIFSRKIIQIK
jgi:PKD repeat protein